MKTVTRNISLAEDLARFAEREVEEGGYGSVSAYFAELIRQRQQSQIEADLAMLKESMRTARPGLEPVPKIVMAARATRKAMLVQRWEPQR
jgi:Arc/MetJ-type ribon-helix-helix transcriptional regulator